LYVLVGGKCVSTREPSGASQRKVWCGNSFTRFQLSFCVKKLEQPLSLMICGSWAQ
jgi:hypothetical protein